MRNAILIFLAILLGTSAESCRKCNDPTNPECKNYNPCLGKSAVSADFVFEVNLDGKWYQVEDVYSGDYVRFRAIQNLSNYTWLIGSETLTDATFVRTGFPAGSNVFCTLIGRSNPDNRCFPKDDGVDTITKSIKIWNYPGPDFYSSFADTVQYQKEPYIGSYYGYKESNPNHKFFVTLSNYWIKNNGAIERLGRVKGLPYEDLEFDSGPRTYLVGFVPYIFKFNRQGNGEKYLWDMHGTGIINKKDSTVVFEFEHQDSSDKTNTKPYIKDKFIGKKIN